MLDPNITKLQQSYDQVPYLSQAYPQSHPNRLATLGHLFGMTPARISNAKVLELGCASGGNIIPMAYFYPDSRFFGVELAQNHVKTARKTISDLGLQNIQIEHGNILDISASWETFDYIICHGVFSWVPESVQEKIFSVCTSNLAEQGVVYISYNTYPGWHMREMVRHMMLYHSNQFEGPKQRLGQAKGFIDFLASASRQNKDDPYAILLRNELECLKNSGDWYIFHDYMEVVNTPIYFHQFIERAGQYNLQYLAESDFSTMFQHEFSNEISNTLEDLSHDIVQKEQYMDFLRNRLFRQTLLCKSHLELKRTLDMNSLEALMISSDMNAENPAIDLSSGILQTFKNPQGRVIETENPIMKAAFGTLRQHWPTPLDFETLFEKCITELNTHLPADTLEGVNWRQELGRGLLHCYASDTLELHSRQEDLFCTAISERPEVNGLTRYQVQNRQYAVNYRHEMVKTDSLALHLIPVLDGTRNRDDMLNHLISLVENHTITLSEYDVPIVDPDKIRKKIEDSIDTILTTMMEAGLLVA